MCMSCTFRKADRPFCISDAALKMLKRGERSLSAVACFCWHCTICGPFAGSPTGVPVLPSKVKASAAAARPWCSRTKHFTSSLSLMLLFLPQRVQPRYPQVHHGAVQLMSTTARHGHCCQRSCAHCRSGGMLSCTLLRPGARAVWLLWWPRLLGAGATKDTKPGGTCLDKLLCVAEQAPPCSFCAGCLLCRRGCSTVSSLPACPRCVTRGGSLLQPASMLENHALV